jgi:hypothetical protein
MDQDPAYLNDLWTLYFHDPSDMDWNVKSYKRLSNISSIEEFWEHHLCYIDRVHQGMFFLMREHVFPCWDDPNNIEGGCMSIKVLKENMNTFWNDICIKILGETLLVDEHRHEWAKITGISTSPKKHFCIIKIWLMDASLSDKNKFNLLPIYYGDLIFKLNRDNISNDNDSKHVGDPQS